MTFEMKMNLLNFTTPFSTYSIHQAYIPTILVLLLTPYLPAGPT
jgi:hypothetical protein